MIKRRGIKKNLGLIKKSSKQTPDFDVKLKNFSQEKNDETDLDINSQNVSECQEGGLSTCETYEECDDSESHNQSSVMNIIGTLKSAIFSAQYDPVGSSEGELYSTSEDWVPMVTPSPTLNKTSSIHRRRWNRKKYGVSLFPLQKGREIADFIKAHPNFTITNSIESFEVIEILENGLSTPRFNFEHHFMRKPTIETGIDLEEIHKGTKIPRILKSMTEMVVIDEENIFELNKFVNARIIGRKVRTFMLKNQIYRVKKVNKTICLFSEDLMITCDLKTLKKWRIPASDTTENNLGEFIVLESDRIINVFRKERLVHRVELNTIIDRIAAYYDRKIIVSTIYKVIFILDLDTKHIEIISGPPASICRAMEVYKNLVVVHTRDKLNFIDLVNKTKHFARFDYDFKFTASNGIIQTHDFRDAFRFFKIENPMENITVAYDEHVKGFEFYGDWVYLAIADTIKCFKGGQLQDEFDAFYKYDEYDFTNTIFLEDDFDRLKTLYNKREDEDLVFLENDLNLELKQDIDRILGRSKVRAKFAESQTDVSLQKKKKGGF